MVRPLTLNDTVQAQIVEAIKVGATYEVACKAAGVNRWTLWEWRKKGKGGKEPFASLLVAVEQARAQFEVAALKKLNNLESSDMDPKFASAQTRALTWLLERTRRERFGPDLDAKINKHIEEAKEELLDAAEGVLATEDFAALLDRLASGGKEAQGAPADVGEPIH